MKRLGLALLTLSCFGLIHSSAFAFNCQSKNSGNWSVSGNWQNCNGTIPQNGDTVIINSGYAITQDINSSVASLTINSGGQLTQAPLLSSLSLTVAGNLIDNGTIIEQPLIGSVTVTVGGSVTVNSGATIDSTGGWLFATTTWNTTGSLTNNGTFTAGPGAISIAGSMTNNSGGQFDLSSGDPNFTLGGNFTNGGTFTPGTGTFTLNGTATQAINNALSVTTLVVNNTGSGVTLSANLTVTGSLTLTDGVVSTGSNTLNYSTNCSPGDPVGSGASFIYGNLQLAFPTGTATCTFPVGSGGLYAPITVAFTNSTGGTLTATTQPDTGGSKETAAGFNTSTGVSRYWTLTKGSIGFTGSYSATLQFNNPADLGPSADPTVFSVRHYTGGSWISPTVGTRTSTTTQATGITQTGFGDFVVGSGAVGGGACAAGITNVINTYYPGSASVSAGATSISLGAATGAAQSISAGDLLIVMQMQGATIDTSNSSSYGTVSAPSAGNYEYVTAGNAVGTGGGTLNITTGLKNAYASAPYGMTGQSTFQVIKVPVYSNYTVPLGGITALGWNGSTGGIVAFDVTGTLTLNGAYVDTSCKGFRGGGGKTQSGGSGANTDYRTSASSAYNGAKGEGIAGTPRYLFTSPGTLTDTGVEGYPNGSNARGAPANAGGGGTDGDPPSNDQNTGGGGGGNGGAGGIGGSPWCSSFSSSNPPYYKCPDGSHPNNNFNPGGIGGSAVSNLGACVLAMGGGGGAGTTNNGTGTLSNGLSSSGVAGGGAIIVRAASMSGSGYFWANGAAGDQTVCNDGSGGGGAAGAVLVYSGSGLSGLSVKAVGGNGGSNLNPANGCGNATPHGPGGGGGGGFVITSAAPGSASVTGGTAGTTYNNGTLFGSYNAANGSAGSSSTGLGSQTPGTLSGTCVGTPSSSPAANFDIVDSYYAQGSYDTAPNHHIFTKLAGWNETTGLAGNTTFKVDVVALNSSGKTQTAYVASGQIKNVKLEIFDDSSGSTSCNSSLSACSSCSKTVVATVNPVTFAYSDAGYKNDVTVTTGDAKAYKRLIARITDANSTPTVYGCSTDAFAVRPQTFTITATRNSDNTLMIASSNGANGSTTVKAGTNFTLTAASGAMNYDGTPKVNANNIYDALTSKATTQLSGSFDAASPSNGQASGTAFTYGEVGYFSLSQDAIYDSVYVDTAANDAANGDCVQGSTSNSKSSGLYGCSVGSAATSWGRFIPDHFTITLPSLTAACSTGAFTYFGQDGFTTVFTITAQNAGNNTTAHYDTKTVDAGNNSYAKLGLTTWGAAPASSSSPGFGFAASSWQPSQPTGATLAASATTPTATNGNTWSAGTTTVTAKHWITRPNSLASDTTLNVTALPVDSDGVTMSSAATVGSSALQRYGRLRLFNAYGSELLPMNVPVRAEYYNGSSWQVNASDGCTSFSSGSVALSSSITSVSPFVPTITFANGLGTIPLIKPTGAGSVDLAINLGIGSGTSDSSCNTSHPATNGAGATWLQYTWCTNKTDPNARATFGTPKSRYIYLRERY